MALGAALFGLGHSVGGVGEELAAFLLERLILWAVVASAVRFFVALRTTKRFPVKAYVGDDPAIRKVRCAEDWWRVGQEGTVCVTPGARREVQSRSQSLGWQPKSEQTIHSHQR